MAGYIGANTSSVTNNQNAAERRKKFTFTANTTALTGLSFLPNKIHIFHNGIRLVKDTDFTEAADGQSVTLVNAAQAGDEVVAVTFAQDPASGGSDYVPTSGGTFTGNVGIDTGTITPRDSGASTLQIGGNGTRSAIKMHTSSSGIGATDGLFLGYDSGPHFYILNSEANGDIKIGTSNSADRLLIDASGRVTMPYQPSFHARRTGGNGTTGTIVFNTADLNIGNNYNTSTGNFTAPIAGRYVFYTTLLSNNATTLGIDLKINGTRYAVTEESWTVNAYRSSSLTVVASLAANDAVRVENKVGGYYGSNHYTFFGGYLLS